jgi:hypothetical protein
MAWFSPNERGGGGCRSRRATFQPVRAWWSYWLTVAVGAILWIGVAIAAGRGGLRASLQQPLWLIILLAPLVVAGINLVVFRRSHEEICRIEVDRHHWLRYLVGDGYSATTFALTGLALLSIVGVVIIARVGGAV